MSEVIENKVVQLQFNNKDFEKNVQESLKTLAKMKESFKMEEAAKSLKNIEAATAKLDFSGLFKKVEEIGYHFTAIGRTADRVFDNIANKVISTGTKMAKAVTIEPVSAGMSKYEQQIKAVQTIVSATGNSVNEIKPYIEELMKYSDDTSYSFTDMVDSLGKFLNAGQSLPDSVKAIKGISNEAAHAGAGIGEANRAMYNFAQSLSQGYVGLIDWKSIDNANLSTKAFKEQLIASAKALGTLDKKGKVAVKGQKRIEVNTTNFNQTLNKQWLTAEVLMDALGRYGDVSTDIGAAAFKAAKETKTFSEVIGYLNDALSSGWLTTLEYIIGDYEEATRLWSAVADELGTIFGEFAETRNETLKIWDRFAGRKVLLDGLKELWETFKEIAGAAKEGWESIFPNDTDKKGKQLAAYTNRFRNWAAGVHEFFNPDSPVGAENLRKISVLFQGIAKLFHGIGDVIARVLGKVSKGTNGAMSPILDLAEIIGTFLFDLGEGLETNKFFTAFANGLSHLVDFMVEYIPQIIAWVKETYNGIKQWLIDSGIVEDVTTATTTMFENLQKNLPIVIDYAKKAFNFIKELIMSTDFKGIYDKAMEYLKPVLDWLNMFRTVFMKVFSMSMNVDTSGIESPIEKLKAKLAPFKILLNWLGVQLAQLGNKIVEKYPIIGTLFEKIRGFYKFAKEALGGDIVGTLKTKVGEFASFVKDIVEKIKSAFSGGLFKKPGELLGGEGKTNPLQGLLKTFDPNNQNGIIGTGKKIGELLDPSKLKLIKFPNLNSTFDQIAGLFATVADFIAHKIPWEGLIQAAKAIAMIRLIWNIGTFVTSLTETMKVLRSKIHLLGKQQKQEDKDSLGDTLLKIAGSLAIAVAAIWVISTMDQSAIDKAMWTLAKLAVGLVAFTFLMGKVSGNGDFEGVGKGLLMASAGLLVMYAALRLYAGLDEETLVKGLMALIPMLLAIAGFIRLSGNGGDFSSFIQLGIGLILLTFPLKELAKMDLEALAKGLVGFGILLLEIGAFTKLAGKSEKSFMSVMAIALAMNMMIFPVKELAKMKTNDLKKGIIAIGVLMLSMGVFAKLSSGNKIVSTVVSIVAMAAALFMIIEAIKYLVNSDMDPDVVQKFAESLGLMMITFGAGIFLLGKNGLMGGINAAVSLLSFLLIMGAALALLGWIKGFFPDIEVFINDGGDLLEKLGEALGKFVNGVLKGIFGANPMDKFMSDLNTMGDGLNEFAAKMEGFSSDSLTEPIKAIAAFADAAQKIPRTGGILQKLIGEKDVNKFAEDLPKLGTGLKGFADNTKGVNTDSVTAASKAVGILVELAKDLPYSQNSVMGKIFGKQSFSEFGPSLNDLGKGLWYFDIWTKNIDSDSVTAAGNAAGVLVKLSTQTDWGDNTVMGFLAGHENLDQFGKTLQEFGKGIKNFDSETEGVDADTVSATANAAGALAALSKQTDFSDKSVLGWLMGHEDLGYFGSSLGDLGSGLKKFQENSSGVTEDSVKAAAAAADVLIALSHKTDFAEGTLMGWLMGKEDLGTFGDKLGQLGSGLATFVKEGNTFTSEQATHASTVLTAALGDLATIKSQVHGLQYGGYTDVTHFLTSTLGAIGTGMRDLEANSKDVNPVHLNMISGVLANIGRAMQVWGSGDGVKGAKSVRDQLKQMAKDDAFLESLKTIAEPLTQGIQAALQNESKDGSATNVAANGYFNSIEGTIGSQDHWDRMYALGGFLMSGLSAGIRDHKGYGEDAAREAVGGTIDAGYEKAESNSPSKVMMRLGRYMDDGLALGIQKSAADPADSMNSMMAGVNSAARTAAETIQYLLDNDPSMSPVITPVFDMTKVREGAGYLNGQINSLNSLRFGGFNTGAIAADVAVNSSNAGIIAAIEGISARIDDLNEAIMTMGISIDGKRLVGSIESDIDRQLGLRAIREERRG